MKPKRKPQVDMSLGAGAITAVQAHPWACYKRGENGEHFLVYLGKRTQFHSEQKVRQEVFRINNANYGKK